MRRDLSVNRIGWIYSLDYRKIILIAFLARFILASIYDVATFVTDRNILLPDGKYYSMRGRYVSLLLNGYKRESFAPSMIPSDDKGRGMVMNFANEEDGKFPPLFISENNFYAYVVGIIYFIFGYFPLGVSILNISLSICSTYLLFRVAERHFGALTANLFLLIALFLPTQIMYSITLSKDFLRMFVVSLMLWLLYRNGGVLCPKRQGV